MSDSRITRVIFTENVHQLAWSPVVEIGDYRQVFSHFAISWTSWLRWSACGILGVVLATIAGRSASATDKDFEVLVRLYYDVEVMSFCGGATSDVVSAFQQEQTSILERYAIDTERDEKARFEAARRADREWNNRGLGGFRHWCRQEGQAAVRRFSPAPVSGRY